MKQPKLSMAEKGIVARLINWGRCYYGRTGGGMTAKETRRTSPYGGGGYQCMTAVICTRMRETAKSRGGAAGPKLDFQDAARIEEAWSKLGVRHKLLLKDLYVLGKSVNAICRLLDIRHAPGSYWNGELRAAQEAIEDLLNNGNR